jgi:SPP1 gp7 family putative phage head morphogenesis protein
MPKSANEQILDATVRHQIKLLRFSQGEANKAAKLLAASDAELVALLEGELTEYSEARLRGLLKEVRRMRAAVAQDIGKELSEDMAGLSAAEAEWEEAMLLGSTPVALSLNSVSAATLKAVSGSPINGVPLEGWLGSMAVNDVRRIEQQLRLGILQGETTASLVQRIRGTRANGYADGVLSTTRREAEMIARTAANHVSAQARQATWDANSDIIKGVRWVATLDGRTSPVCQSRDGEIYPIDEGPRPPAHPNCRSSVAPVLDGEEIVGERPTVTDTRTRREREVDFRADARDKAGKAWSGMSAGERNAAIKAQRDAWTATNIGQTPTTTNYQTWLKGQSKEFQDDVLGRGKAELFRKGMTLDKFVDEKGKPYSLDQLKAELNGDKLNVIQPGVGLKAKSLLQQGMSSQEVLDTIKGEYPDASTSLASIASYKTDLKKAGLLDLPEVKAPAGSLKKAQSVQGVVEDLDASLPPNLKQAIGGQWATVVDELEGTPGTYGHYQAGKGVTLSGKKLSSIPAVQAKQVAAHELGHLLHKQHELMLPDEVLQAAKLAANQMPADIRKLYSYYFSNADELVAEIYAQAMSPSTLTSQGLSALEFNKAFAPAIDAAKKAIAGKWPTVAPGVKPPIPGGPAVPFEVAGKHTSVGSLSKALLQQGVPDQQVLDAVLAEFPNAKTKMASIASYKSELKKAGLLPNKASGPVVAAKPIPDVAKVPPTAQAGSDLPEWSIKSSSQILAYDELKGKSLELMKAGMMNNTTLLKTMQQAYPDAMKHHSNVGTDTMADWKDLLSPAEFDAAVKKQGQSAMALAASGPLKAPKLAGKKLGNTSQKALENAKSVLWSGGTPAQAKKAMESVFGTLAEPGASDLVELAQYEVASIKASGKPYLNASYQTKAPSAKKAKSTPHTYGAPAARVDMTPDRPAMSPRDGLPPPPRFNSQQRRQAVAQYDGKVDTYALNRINEEQKRHGLPELEPEEAAAIRAYTGGTYAQLNSALRNGSYASTPALQAYVEAAQHGLSKMPKYVGEAARGMSMGLSEMQKFLTVYQKGAIVEEAAFISSSSGSRAAFGGNIFLKIKSRTGVDVSSYSRHPHEREVLFMPGTRFRVLDVVKDKNSGTTTVSIEEIE